MNKLLLRKIARIGVGLGSLGLVVGGVLIWRDVPGLGDTLMVAGGILLLISALLLAQTPTGDKTIKPPEERNTPDAG